MTVELQPTLEVSEIEWPTLKMHIPKITHDILLAFSVFMSSLGVKCHTKSWGANECYQQFGETEFTDIGKNQ